MLVFTVVIDSPGGRVRGGDLDVSYHHQRPDRVVGEDGRGGDEHGESNEAIELYRRGSG